MRFLLLALAASACGNGTNATTSACSGLDLHDCRLDPSCAPDICDGCGCGTTYRGCLATGDEPAMCPALGCPSGICCSAEKTCASNTGSCAAPGSSRGCGACNTMAGDCTTDASCTVPKQICEPIECSCAGASACVDGCVDDTTCSEGTHCNTSTARCVATTCTDASQCPANFACTSNACARMSCTTDDTCDGYCVEQQCYSQLGDCQLPVP